ncbi:TetR family transcriptional regulator [Paenibacillus helianthi]|uniref:TetR family transcriptional regulator n=1 Tax=Paenibacillus helianthi TaxID=1349432 RepID=A0ABX3EJV6_9BACL|nr:MULTISPECIES: TetR/AcrR family transcriptional regulator [Paenibacillus]OKP75529.1 TetR family transcriptional regulator [Paenibacillus sp. P3E]OKP84674.1 TetR family transcriptional regulator [Paenibacillus helianthi]
MARSKEFDVDNVLGKAMNVFWQQGYEKTSMQDLVTGMGIHKRSMYDTFGDKHTLYIKAMERFAEMTASKMEGRVEGTDSAKEAIRLLFDTIIYKQESEPTGCLLVNTAVELANHDPAATSKVNEAFLQTEQLFERLVVQGQASGEISSRHQAANLAVFLHNALVGLRVMVKTTPDKDKLQTIADTTLAMLD